MKPYKNGLLLCAVRCLGPDVQLEAIFVLGIAVVVGECVPSAKAVVGVIREGAGGWEVSWAVAGRWLVSWCSVERKAWNVRSLHMTLAHARL